LTDAELVKVAEQFHLLSEPMRLKILQALSVRPLTVGEIVAATVRRIEYLKASFSAASAGVITRQKDGQFVYYGVSSPLTLKLCELVPQGTAEPIVSAAVEFSLPGELGRKSLSED